MGENIVETSRWGGGGGGGLVRSDIISPVQLPGDEGKTAAKRNFISDVRQILL